MKKIILTLTLLFAPSFAWAQCTGVFPPATVCGSVAGGIPTAVSPSGFSSALQNGTTVITGGSANQVLYDNAGKLGEFTPAQLTAQVNQATAGLSGAVPAWPNNTTTFYRGDGTYAAIGCINVPALTGDLTTLGGSCATTLATVNSNVGSFGDAANHVTITVNAKGLITAITNVTPSIPFTDITGQATLAQLPTIGPSTVLSNVTGGSSTPLANNLSAIIDTIGSAQGSILYRDTNANNGWSVLAPGSSGQLLTTNGAGANPAWTTASGTGTVTSVTCGQGLSGGTITATGTCALISIGTPQGRITLVTGTPVMNANETAKGTLFYDCYRGNAVPYYTGTVDTFDAISSCEVSDVMVSAASAGQVVSGQVYDVWWVHGGANRICVAMSAAAGGGGGWANDTGGSNTARGTGYSQLDFTTRPYITNKNSITNCFNAANNYGPVSANQGTYLGSIYATANGQTGMAFTVTANGGGGNILGVFNAYNQVQMLATSIDNTSSWSTNSSTWRQADSNTGNAIQWLDGLQISSVDGSYDVLSRSGTANTAGGAVGCALDWASGGPTISALNFGTGASAWVSLHAVCSVLPQIGLHSIKAIESSFDNAATISFYGSGFGGNTTNEQALKIRLQM